MMDEHEVSRRAFLLSTAMVTASAAVAYASPVAGAGMLASLDAAQGQGSKKKKWIWVLCFPPVPYISENRILLPAIGRKITTPRRRSE